MIIKQSCINDRIYDFLGSNPGVKKVCILFNHGLGDYLLFIPVFNGIKEIYRNIDFKLGSLPEKGFKCLHQDAIFVTPPYGKYSEQFDAIFNINYIEPIRNADDELFIGTALDKNSILKNLSKPELCNELEVGIPNFKWKYYRIPINNTKVFNHNRVGVHFFGYAWGEDKNVDVDISEKIWNEIKECGFDPYEIQMIPPNKVGIIEQPSYLNKENSLRFNYPNLRLMIQEISKCKYFIGVDSGPLYLALSLLGPDGCIGLQKNREINKVWSNPSINIVNVNNYKKGSISSLIKEGENNV